MARAAPYCIDSEIELITKNLYRSIYSNNILTDHDQSQKTMLKHSYSDNKYLLNHQKLSSSLKHHDSTYSLPILLNEKTSFAQLIAEEKHNLQFFRSFEETRKITDKKKDKKKLIGNFHLLSYNIPNNYYSVLNSSTVLANQKSTTGMTHSSNFSYNMLSNMSSTKKTTPITVVIAHKTRGIIGVNRKRRMHWVKRHINYINNEQTKATLCFILQLNTYINQKILSLQKESNKINKYYVQSKKLDESPLKIIELDTNTTSTLDFISKSNLNDSHLAETNDSIDISIQLSDNLDSSSKLILKNNENLLAFYNRPIMNNTFDKTTNSIEPTSNDEINIYNIAHLSLKKERKAENSQASVTKDKIVGCCSSLSKSMSQDAINHIQMQKTPTKSGEFLTSTSSKFNNKMAIDIPVPEIVHITDISTIPLQRIQMPMKSIENSEMKDSISNKTEINIHQQSTILKSSQTDYNYHISKSSIDLKNLLNESNENESSLPLHSQCLLSFEIADRDTHLVEVAELPRSLYRNSRMDTYKKIRERLVLMNLIDIDLSALLRTVLQSFS